jgi:hypothetical protein
MEYTAADTPQQNALVNSKFTYLAAKDRAAMHAAGVPRERRLDFFPGTIMTMTKLDWLKLITISGAKKTRIEHYGLPLPRLPIFTYMGRIRNHQNRERQKTGERGVTCMFVGYASNHEGDCYKMWNLKTKMVSKTCDMVFLDRMFFKAPENTKKLQKKQDPDDTELESV